MSPVTQNRKKGNKFKCEILGQLNFYIVTCYQLTVTTYQLPVTCYQLSVTSILAPPKFKALFSFMQVPGPGNYCLLVQSLSGSRCSFLIFSNNAMLVSVNVHNIFAARIGQPLISVLIPWLEVISLLVVPRPYCIESLRIFNPTLNICDLLREGKLFAKTISYSVACHVRCKFNYVG